MGIEDVGERYRLWRWPDPKFRDGWRRAVRKDPVSKLLDPVSNTLFSAEEIELLWT